MKKVVLSLTLVQLFTSAFSQDTTLPVLTREDYLRKSKSQKSAAWVLLGTGIASLLGSVATYEFTFWGDQGAIDNSESTAFAIIGAGSLVSSTALFISAGQNRRKAASLALINQPILIPHQVSLASKTQPAICLRIAL